MRYYILFFCAFFTTTLYSQITIDKIEFSGLIYTKVRVMKEIPIKKGDIWDQYLKNKLLDYFEGLKGIGILENVPVKVEEQILDNNKVNLKIYLNENIPFFLFPLPFWSTSSLLKLKLRFWVFYLNGYPIPFDGYIEFIERGALSFILRFSDIPLNKERNFTMTFNLSSFTTLLNYVIQYQYDDNVFKKYKKGDTLYPNWENGFENINLAFKYYEPNSRATFYPSLGFNFKNYIKTDNSRDITTPIIYSDTKIMLNPKFDFGMPIKNTNLGLGFRIGFVYKHYNTTNTTFSEIWKWNDEKKIIYKEKDKIPNVKEENHYLIGIGNVDAGSMNGYPNPVNDSYLSSIGISGVRIPLINCYLSSSFGFGFQNYINEQDFTKNSIQFRLKPTVNLHIPLNMIMANLYINLGFNYTGNDFVYDPDGKEYLGSTLNISLNSDDPASNPIEAKINFNLLKINATIMGYFGLAYNSQWYNPIKEFPTVYQNKITNALKIKNGIEYTQNIPEIASYITNRAIVVFWKWYNIDTSDNKLKYVDKFIYDSNDPTDNKFFIEEISSVFYKKIPLDPKYLNSVFANDETKRKVDSYNSFAFKYNFCFPESNQYLFAIYKKSGQYGAFPGNFVFQFDLAYNLYLPVYKENIYKMRLWIFGRVNSVKNYVATGSYNDANSLDYWFREDRATKIGYFGGFAGILMNFEYKMPLFVIDTSSFFNYKLGKNYFWKVFWNIYLDCGLSINSNSVKVGDNRYSFDGLNNLHLIPAMTVGTSFKIYPSFVPVVANLEISYSIDGKLLLQRNDFTSYLFIGFSFSRIDEISGNGWFGE
ncbi:MAG TPA: hypothetical protein PK771_01215 [Spirochaetota bacterium]|nr:hypothetical protein [Spirochaetota bacterium]